MHLAYHIAYRLGRYRYAPWDSSHHTRSSYFLGAFHVIMCRVIKFDSNAGRLPDNRAATYGIQTCHPCHFPRRWIFLGSQDGAID